MPGTIGSSISSLESRMVDWSCRRFFVSYQNVRKKPGICIYIYTGYTYISIYLNLPHQTQAFRRYILYIYRSKEDNSFFCDIACFQVQKKCVDFRGWFCVIDMKYLKTIFPLQWCVWKIQVIQSCIPLWNWVNKPSLKKPWQIWSIAVSGSLNRW